MPKTITIVTIFLFVLSISLSGIAQEPALSDQDRKFMEKAALGSMMEVQLGEMAKENAGDDEVKAFGERMVTDHSKANEQLKELAAEKKVNLPAELDEKHMEKVDKLKDKTGAEFDSKYMTLMVKDHQEDVEKFRKQAQEGNDPELKQFAADTVKVLEGHLESAGKIHGRIETEKTKPAQ